MISLAAVPITGDHDGDEVVVTKDVSSMVEVRLELTDKRVPLAQLSGAHALPLGILSCSVPNEVSYAM